MIIKELTLIHFGKFHDMHIEFGPSMNIIYGPNESGKSTIHGFIRCMLFGVRRGRGRAAAADDYTRYRPWDMAGGYEGTLVFEHQGKSYRIYRNFSKEAFRVVVTDMESGEALELPQGTITDIIPELTEENYKNTVYICQRNPGVAPGFALTLQSHEASTLLDGSEQVHLGQAMDYLRQLKRGKNAQDVSGEIRELTGKVNGINEELKRMPELALRQEQLKEMLITENQLKEEMERRCNDCLVQRELLKSQCENKQKELEILGESDTAVDIPDLTERELKALESKVAQARSSIRGNLQNPDNCAQDVWDGHDEAFGTDRPKLRLEVLKPELFGIIVAVFVLAATLFIGLAAFKLISVSAAGAGISIGLLLTLYMLRRSRCIGYTKTHTAQEPDNREPVFDGSEQEDVPQDYMELDRLSRVDAYRKKCETLQTEIESLYFQHENALQAWRQAKMQADAQKKHYEDVRRQYEKVIWEQERLWTQEVLKNSYMETLAELGEQEGKYLRDMEAIQLAMQTIEGLAKDIHRTMGAKMNEAMEKLLDQITGNERHLRMGSDMKLSIDNQREYVDISRLSVGTVDQIYLALRLNAGALLYGQENYPLILDDAFAMYDAQRLKRIMEWLMENYHGQMLLFTCHHREADLLDTSGYDYNYVNL